ncbi:hypothetical protein F70K44_048 [Acinetobacter phage F70-K44]|uniref:Uncharacterized protein n=1 Tax=Acinetobacter phage F70-K44 TaxID=3027985 RepID=A0AAE9ZLJ9_9CAUD|nr:hypothetical protein F70K44_048 [Acinetobacter phage F70-K44]
MQDLITVPDRSVMAEYRGEQVKCHPVYLSTEVIMKLVDIAVEEGFEYIYEDTLRKLLGL